MEQLPRREGWGSSGGNRLSELHGVYYDLPEHVYRADPAICQTDLKVLGRSPAHLMSRMNYDEEREDSDSMLMGKIAGTLALEPDRKPWWTVIPDGLKLNTKEGIAFKKEHAGEELVSYSLFRRACGMATSVMDHPIASEILRGAEREVSVFSDIETDHGVVRRKARLDIVTSGNVITDLKSTRDARPDGFGHSVAQYGYAVQAAWYVDIWNSVNPKDIKEVYLLIAVENIAPHCVWVHQLSGDYIANGRQEYRRLLERYAECLSKNEWPGYPVEINKLQPS